MLESNAQGKPAIVVGTNGSPRGRAAVVRASVLAYSRDAVLHVVCAHDREDSVLHKMERFEAPPDVGFTLTPRSEASLVVTEAVQTARSMGAEAAGYTVHSSALRALHHMARTTAAEMIVVGGSRKRNRLIELVSPSVARELAATGLCPVVVVSTPHGPVLRLVAGAHKVVEVDAIPDRVFAIEETRVG